MSSQLYSELPLDPAKRQIRILQFCPSVNTNTPGVIECQMVRVSLDDSPTYYAVSYTWGDATERREILINGLLFDVPYNTYEALRYLRQHDGAELTGPLDTVNIWIDAVKFMDKVYSRSTEVLVWLGDDNGRAPETYELVERLVTQCDAQARKVADDEVLMGTRRVDTAEKPKYMYGRLWKFRQTHEARLSPVRIPEKEVMLAKALYVRPWFNRIWILQKVTLTRQVTCYYGRHQLALWKILVAAKWLLKWTGSFDFLAAMQIYDIGNHRALLGNYLASCMSRKASDPRDRVFAFLGLLDQQNRVIFGAFGDVEPDYRKSTDEVLRDAVRYCIWEGQTLVYLDNVKVAANKDDASSLSLEHPSWVHKGYLSDEIDYVEPPPASILQSPLMIRNLDDPNILSVRGTSIDLVDQVHYTFEDEMADENIHKEVSRCITSTLEYERTRSDIICEQSFVKNVCRSLVCRFLSYVGDLADAEHALDSFSRAWNGYEEKISDPPSESTLSKNHTLPHKGSVHPGNQDLRLFLKCVKHCASGYSLFSTAETSLGLCVRAIRADDVVVRLSGAETPAVLRRKGDF